GQPALLQGQQPDALRGREEDARRGAGRAPELTVIPPGRPRNAPCGQGAVRGKETRRGFSSKQSQFVSGWLSSHLHRVEPGTVRAREGRPIAGPVPDHPPLSIFFRSGTAAPVGKPRWL